MFQAWTHFFFMRLESKHFQHDYISVAMQFMSIAAPEVLPRWMRMLRPPLQNIPRAMLN